MIPPRLRTYSEQRTLDAAKVIELRRLFSRRLKLLLASLGAIVLNLMRG